MVRPHPALISIVAALAFAPSASATTRNWPGVAPCDGTLQACINGATDGDLVLIASNGTIDETILITDRLVSLRAAEGYHPTLAAGRNLIVDYSPSGTGLTVPFDLSYGGLAFASGRAEFDTTHTGTFLIERLDVTHVGNYAALALLANGTDTGSPTHFIVRENRVRLSMDGHNAILSNGQRPIHAIIEDNLIESLPGTPANAASRIGVEVFGTTANGAADIRRNRIVASSDPDVIAPRLRQGMVLAPFGAASNFQIRVIDNWIDVGTSDQDVAISSIVPSGNHWFEVVNNTIRATGAGVRLYDSSATATALTGIVANNIIVRRSGYGSARGIDMLPLGGTMFNSFNLLYNTDGDAPFAGTGTVFADPQFVGPDNLRLKSTSPAIDAGDGYPRIHVLPRLGEPVAADGDGLRRTTGAQVDIGAIEYGDAAFAHNATTASQRSTVSRPGLDGNAAALMLIGRSGGTDPASVIASPETVTQSFGEFTQQWAVGTDDGSTLLAGTGFSLFQPVAGGMAGTHVATSANNFSSWGSSLGSTWTILPSDWVFLVTPTRGAGLSITADPHPVGAAMLNGAWRIRNTDSAAMPNGAAFVVYAQPPTRSAFIHAVSAANRVTPVVSLIDHPALNGLPCANPVVSVAGDGVMPTPSVSVRYEPALQRWYLLNASSATTLSVGNRYAVLIDPKASAEACRGPVFSDGFE